MKLISSSVLTLCLILFSPIIFSNTLITPTTKTENVYTEDQSNVLINAAYPEFAIKLKSNPTTGYSWFLREYNANLITPMTHSFLPPDQQLIGASGYELWTFRVKLAAFVVPHQTLLRLIYTRPWQSDDSATQLLFRVATQSK